MKTWKTIAAALGLVAMSGVAWGHGATGRSLGRDVNGPPAAAEQSRIGGEVTVGIPRGNDGSSGKASIGGRVRTKSLHLTARERAAGAATARIAPKFGAQTISGAGVGPVNAPVAVMIAGSR